MMKRRAFITLLGGAVTAWPLAARAQQPKAMRHIGVLTGGFGPDSQARLDAFLKALVHLGWRDGENVRLEIRRGGGNADAIRKHAAELAALAPDVIMAIGGTATGRLLQATRTVPIVFAIVPDPVGSGFVTSLSRPGGAQRNSTGCYASCDTAGPRRSRRYRPVRGHPVRSAIAWRGGNPDQRAGPLRNRA